METCGEANFPTLECYDEITGAVGPKYCGTTLYNDMVSFCCPGETLVPTGGTCAPAVKPSAFPTTQPSDDSCFITDDFPPCDYEFDKDTLEIVETYYAMCVQDTSKGKLIYYQECYPSSILAGVSEDDPDPEHPDDDDRFIAFCGCCPTSADENLPEDITDVKDIDKVDVCNGGIDCIEEDFTPTKVSKSGAPYVDYCINGSKSRGI